MKKIINMGCSTEYGPGYNLYTYDKNECNRGDLPEYITKPPVCCSINETNYIYGPCDIVDDNSYKKILISRDNKE